MKYVLLSVGLLLSALSAPAQVSNTFTGSLTATDPTIPGGRLNRTGLTAICGSTTSYPGLVTAATGTHYDTYTITNPSTATSVCATLTLTPACSEGTSDYLFCSVYATAFDRLNLVTNYRSDMGASPTTAPVSMSVTVGAREVLVIVINGIKAESTCSAYRLTVSSPVALAVRGAQEAAAPLTAYPNPVEDVLHMGGAKASQYTLYNATGAVVKRISGSEASLRDLPGGVYMLQQDNTKAATRIVKL